MRPIITPALVRRYLIATGWTEGEAGHYVHPALNAGLQPSPGSWNLPGPVALAAAMSITVDVLGSRLGMLAAAEMLRASFAAEWAPGEDESVERFVRGEIRGMTLAASVHPEAWEKARNT